MLSAKQPTVPDTTETITADNGFATMPKRYATIPIMRAPSIPTPVPNGETAPFVPGSTF